MPGLGYAVAKETSARPDIAVSSISVDCGVFLALTTLVLLVACVNVTNLMLPAAMPDGRDGVAPALGAGNALSFANFSQKAWCSRFRIGTGTVARACRPGWISNYNIAVNFPVRFKSRWIGVFAARHRWRFSPAF